MSLFKKTKLVMLSTKKASHIHVYVTGKKFFITTSYCTSENYEYKSKHFYLISDKEIPHPEYYDKICMFIGQNNSLCSLAGKHYGTPKSMGNYYEIIATTDKELDIPNVFDFSDLFISELVKVNDIKSEIREINVKYIDEETIYSNDNKILIEKLNWDKDELKFIATRFAHECRLKGVNTNDETCNLWDTWAEKNL